MISMCADDFPRDLPMNSSEDLTSGPLKSSLVVPTSSQNLLTKSAAMT